MPSPESAATSHFQGNVAVDFVVDITCSYQGKEEIEMVPLDIYRLKERNTALQHGTVAVRLIPKRVTRFGRS